MDKIQKRNKWSVAIDSVIGSAHLRSNSPNQDSVKHIPGSIDDPVVVSLADGHGSSKCFRSHVGSQFAVDVACEVLFESANAMNITTLSSLGSNQSIDKFLRNEVPAIVCREWNERVSKHFTLNPILSQQFEVLSDYDKELIQKQPSIAYGSTLISVLITSNFIFYLQIGDGEIITVSDDGLISRPLPSDSRLLGNETTSLAGILSNLDRNKSPRSSYQPSIDFRVRMIPLNRDLPSLILLSTDGYPNSFQTLEDFDKVGSDLHNMIQEFGFDKVSIELKNWLSEASEIGSGDDVSIGLIHRVKNTECISNEQGRSETGKRRSVFKRIFGNSSL